MTWTSGLDETAIRLRIPVFINSYNQLTYLRDTVDWFARHGFGHVTVHDNKSDYPPLLAYFETPDFTGKARLVRLPGNIGPRRSLAVAAEDPTTADGFIFTDPDLRLPEPPAPDLLTTMFDIGRRHGVVKVGLALSLDPEVIDLGRPAYRTRTVRQVERRHWTDMVEPGVFKAPTDTTFFLHVPQAGDPQRFKDLGSRQPRLTSLRIARDGFVAIHRPWLIDSDLSPAEQAAYAGSEMFSTIAGAQAASPSPVPHVQPGTGQGRKTRRVAPPSRRDLANPKTFLLRAFADSSSRPIVFVQVGANDGRLADPLFPLIAEGGWQGLMIEPHPVYFADLAALHATRPALILRNIAIGAEPGRMELFHLNEAARRRYPRGLRGCASLDRTRMEAAMQRVLRRNAIEVRPDDIVATSVEVQRLDAVLAEVGIARAAIVVIDVEGFEMQVLNSFNLTDLQPDLVLVECNGANMDDEPAITAVMEGCGLRVLRLGDDLVGLRPAAIAVPVETVLGLLGVTGLKG